MKEPYYFADEKELFAKIFEMSDELTRNLKTERANAGVPSKKRKIKPDASVQNSDPGQGQMPPRSN